MMARLTLRFCAAVATLVALIVLLHLAARLDLRGPTGFTRADLDDWSTDTVRLAATVARWLALGLSYYMLAVVLIVGLEGGQHRNGPGRLLPARLAATVGAILGVGAVAVPLAHRVTTHEPPADPAPASTGRLELALIEERLRLTTIRDTTIASSAPRQPPAPVRQPDPDLTWPVESGDHLWSISEETLSETWGRSDLTEAEIATYWRTVIAANEHLFVEPGNPDLILPGQTMILPPPPPDPLLQN